MKKMFLLVFLVLFSIVGCGKKKVDEGKTVVVSQNADAKSLDPHATNDNPSSRVMVQIYNTLVDRDENLDLISGLAESWEEVDNKKYIFNLRKGVKFHNGEELKASDVVFTLNRMLESPRVNHIVGPISNVIATDDYTVEIELSKPFAPLLFHLAHPASAILNEKAVLEAGKDYGQNPVGTGPFKFKEWLSGDKIILENFGEYYEGTSPINKLVFRNIIEGTNRVIGLETGEIDISYDIEPIDIDQVRNNEKLTLEEEVGLSMTYLGFNTVKEPYTNPVVRKAIAHGINVDDIVEAVVLNAGTKANSPIPKGVFGYTDSVKPIEYDPKLAKAMLKDAGIENFHTKIWTNDNPVRRQIAQIVQAQLNEIGVTAEVEYLEWGAFLEGTAREEHEIIILGWGNVTGDADYSTYAVFHSSTPAAAGRRTVYSNPELDKYLDIGREATNPIVRSEAYLKAQEIIREEAPMMPLYYPKYNAGISKKIEGFKINPMGHHKIYGVSIKQ